MTTGVVVVAATSVASTRLMSGMARTAEIPPVIPQGDQHGYLPSAASTLCGLPLEGLTTIPDLLFSYPGPAAVCDHCRRAAVRDELTTSSPGYHRVPGRYRDGRGLRTDVLRAVIELGADLRAALGDRLVGWHVDSQDCVDLGGDVLRALAEIEGGADVAPVETVQDVVRDVVDRFVDLYPQWQDTLEINVLDRREVRPVTRPRASVDGQRPGTASWYEVPGRAWPLLGPPISQR